MGGRNDPCPCGSGKKYKLCCGRLALAATPPADHTGSELAALMQAGRFAELESRAQQLLVEQPQSGILWQLLAVALGKQGKNALDALTRAVQCLPDDAVAHLNLGNALARLGRLEEAHAGFRQALAIRPDFAEAHNNLGELLLESGRAPEALASCRRAVEIRPDFAEAHAALGRTLRRLARVDEAIASFRRALEIKPRFTETWVSLGNALRSVGRLDEAVAAYRQALLVDPQFAAAHTELGTALRLQRRTAESEESCRNALKLKPDSARALAVLADLSADAGRFDEAQELLRRVIDIDPDSPEAWTGIARLRRMTQADGAWLAAAQRIAASGLSPQREVPLRFAIGKYFDDINDFDNAFLNYRRANDLAKRCGPAHDRNQLTRTIDAVIRSHDHDWVNRARDAVNPSIRPVFIVGMLRSGTTLAEQILASHPSVHGAGELTFWGATASAALACATAAVGRGIDISEASVLASGKEYLDLLLRLSADAARVVDKFPTNFLFLGLIHAALPQARIIHMRRNPIDTCLSIYFQHFEAANTQANDLDDLAHYYREYRRLMRHWRAVLPPGAMLEVPYEGLVQDLGVWSRRMLDFIDLPWEPRCLEFHSTARTVVTASRWQVRQKISTSSVGRWRNYERFVGPLRSLLES